MNQQAWPLTATGRPATVDEIATGAVRMPRSSEPSPGVEIAEDRVGEMQRFIAEMTA